MNYKTIVLCILLINLQLLLGWFVLPIKAETTYLKSPSDTWKIGVYGWSFPTFAYASDDSRAVGIKNMAHQGYKGYGFSLSGATIEKVEVGFEWYETSGGIGGYVSWDGSSTWEYIMYCQFHDVEGFVWVDVTEKTDWTPIKLDDSHLATSVKYQTGGGCYGLDAEVGLWEGGLKKVRDVIIGDILTGWNQSEIEMENEETFSTQFVPSTVINVTLHEGFWNLTRIIAENVYNSSLHKDVLVTLDHKLPYISEYEETDNKTKIKVEVKRAEDFVLGDELLGFMKSEMNETTGEMIPAYFTPYQVSQIDLLNTTEGVMDIQTDTKFFMGHYLLQEKVPWTGYVDWIPIRVTYTIEEFDENSLIVLFIIGLGIGICVMIGAKIK